MVAPERGCRGAEEQRSRGAEEQRSRGAEEQRSRGAGVQGCRGAEEQRSRGAEEQRSRGAEEQRSRGAEEQGKTIINYQLSIINYHLSLINYQLFPTPLNLPDPIWLVVKKELEGAENWRLTCRNYGKPVKSDRRSKAAGETISAIARSFTLKAKNSADN